MTKEKAIQTAAAWWIDKLRQQSPHSNGDNNPASIFACILADIGAKDDGLEAKLEVFRTELERNIAADMDYMHKVGFNHTWLGCDYGPGQQLADAADKAGINHLAFPFKTNMRIEWNRNGDYSVTVSDGYAQPHCNVPPIQI